MGVKGLILTSQRQFFLQQLLSWLQCRIIIKIKINNNKIIKIKIKWPSLVAPVMVQELGAFVAPTSGRSPLYILSSWFVPELSRQRYNFDTSWANFDTSWARVRTRILKRIPHAARSLAASRLSSILSDIMVSNDPVGWLSLFRFPSRCFKAPVRGGKRRNLTSWVKAQINEEADPPIEAESSSRRWSKPVSSDPDSRLTSRVSSKLGAGDSAGVFQWLLGQYW